MSDGPIFLVGLAYSGKTPLRIALGLHPGLELTRGSHLWDRFAGALGDLADDERWIGALAVLAADPGVSRLEPDPVAIRAAFTAGPRTEDRLFALVHTQHAERAGARRWGSNADRSNVTPRRLRDLPRREDAAPAPRPRGALRGVAAPRRSRGAAGDLGVAPLGRARSARPSHPPRWLPRDLSRTAGRRARRDARDRVRVHRRGVHRRDAIGDVARPGGTLAPGPIDDARPVSRLARRAIARWSGPERRALASASETSFPPRAEASAEVAR